MKIKFNITELQKNKPLEFPLFPLSFFHLKSLLHPYPKYKLISEMDIENERKHVSSGWKSAILYFVYSYILIININ